MKDVIKNSGFIGAIKWNGRWFSDQNKEFSRIILPSNTMPVESKNQTSLQQAGRIFLKHHKEGDRIYDQNSFVFEILEPISLEDTKQFDGFNVLWAYRKNGKSFVKVCTLEEVTHFLSKN